MSEVEGCDLVSFPKDGQLYSMSDGMYRPESTMYGMARSCSE